ncbi:MAG: ABC transporter substrate-binding protein, partial [Gemmatimonadota bacterium]
VILVAGSDNARTVEQFRRLGVPSMLFRLNRLPELRSTIARLGVILGRQTAADSLWLAIDAQLAAVRRRTRELDPLTVYYDIAYPPPITIGAGSYLDALLAIAGGRNVFNDIAAPSPTVNLEAIVVRDPDVIVYPVSAAWGGAAHPGERPLWRGLRAVTTGSVRQVDADLLHRLGPRVGEAARHLAEAIHPELFGNTP